MKAVAVLVICLVAGAQASHPIENVIELLQGLSSKVEAEGKAEALTFEKFEYWCKNSVKTLDAAIAEEHATIESLESTIASKTEDEATLTDQIKKLTAEIAALDASGVKAKAVREETADLYAQTNADLSSTIAAVDEALAALEKARDDTEAAAANSLVQKVLPLVESATSESQRGVLEAFVQEEPDRVSEGVERPDQLAKGDRKAHVDKYASKSHSVIELLKGLKAKFESEQLAATKAETNSLNSYDLAKQARDDATKAANTAKDKKSAELADTQAALAKAKGELAATQADLEADSKSLSDTKATCARKSREWDERSKTRAGELEAMASAVKILSKATGVRTEPPTNPVPPPSPLKSEAPAFLQLAAGPKTRAIELLRKEAAKTHSRALGQLAQEISAHLTGPFDEVNNMIEKMIFRLMAEQKDEDDHKNWCDLELSKTNASIVDKQEKSDKLNADIDAEVAAVQQLSEEIKAADEMVADIVSHMKMAAEIRAIGKKENALAVKDAEDAQTAVTQAIAVLEDFYKSSGKVRKEAWEFLQRQKNRASDPVELPAEPSSWDAEYTGLGQPANQPNGIISVLEGVSSEFATMEADTKAQEAEDQESFETEMKDCEIEKTRRESESKEKNQDRKNRNERIASLRKVLKHTDTEIEKTQQYLKDLQPACVEGDSTYEDRKAARTQEVDALHEAQGILADAFKEEEKPTSFLRHRKSK